MGKQITGYLRGNVAEAWEKAVTESGKTSYALLNEAVHEWMAKRGYVKEKSRIIPVNIPGPARARYEAEVERTAQAIVDSTPDVAKRVHAMMQEEGTVEAKPEAPRRLRRRPRG